MSIGGGIALFVIGAILAFAVNLENAWVNLDLIGYILMGAGAVVFIIGLVMLMRRRQTESVTRTTDSSGREQVSRRTTSSDEDVV